MSVVPIPELRRSVLAEIEERRQELVELCSSVVRIPSENPPGDTRAIAAFVTQYLTTSGLRPEIHAPKADSPNVVATIGEPGARPNIVLNAHLDEFPADPTGWSDPPFSGLVRDGRIYGRGAADMKGGVAAALFIGRILGRRGLPQGRITLTFVSDEETGGRWGTSWLLDNVSGSRGDACIIGDQLGTWAIGIAEKGLFWLRVRAQGHPGHAAYGSARSANKKLLQAATAILELAGQRSGGDTALTAVIERQRPQMARWGDEAGELIDRVSVNVGVLSGGISPNLVADRAIAEVDIRLPVGIGIEEIEAEILSRLERDGLVDVGLETISLAAPSYTTVDHALVRAMVANTRELRGEASLPVVRLGASDARLFRPKGVPTVVYGPAAFNMGGINECITVDDLILTTATHAGTALDLIADGLARQ